MINRIIFGLGSNLGDRNYFLEKAVLELEKNLNLKSLKKSGIFKNPAMLMPDSPKEWDLEFFNIAFSADIDLEEFFPEKILNIIKEIEKNLGRNNALKWAPREIDIDILAIDDLKIEISDKLIIPHYDLLNREFFVKTVIEIEPMILKKLI